MNNAFQTVSIEQLPDLKDQVAMGLDSPLVVTVGGEKKAVLLSTESFERMLGEREVLRRLALGDLEFAGSEGHPMHEVLEDCDLLLEES